MTFKPAHKDTDNPPGQIVNPLDRSKTIGGIIDRVMRSEAQSIKQKLTFDEFLLSCAKREDGSYPYGYDPSRPRDFLVWGTTPALLEKVWKAAQENV